MEWRLNGPHRARPQCLTRYYVDGFRTHGFAEVEFVICLRLSEICRLFSDFRSSFAGLRVVIMRKNCR